MNREIGSLRPVLSTQDRVLDQRQRVSMTYPKLGLGNVEVLARLGEVETIQIETTNHFAVPGIPKPFERRRKASRVERAPNFKQPALTPLPDISILENHPTLRFGFDIGPST